MKIFLSWSGDISHRVAKLIDSRILAGCPGLETWVSDRIRLGDVWLDEVLDNISSADAAIVFVTKENLLSPSWLLFEAGAIFNQVGKSTIISLLHDVPVDDLPKPLKIFQAARISKDSCWRAIKSCYQASGEEALHLTNNVDAARNHLDSAWPQIETDLAMLGPRYLRPKWKAPVFNSAVELVWNWPDSHNEHWIEHVNRVRMDLNALNLSEEELSELVPLLKDAAADSRSQEMHGMVYDDEDEDQRPDTDLAKTIMDALDLEDTWELWIKSRLLQN